MRASICHEDRETYSNVKERRLELGLRIGRTQIRKAINKTLRYTNSTHVNLQLNTNTSKAIFLELD